MTREEVDSETFNAEIAAGGSTSLELTTGRADELVVYVDDGSTGGQPASYSTTVDANHDEFNDYHRQETVASGNDYYHEFTANGRSMSVTIADESGGGSTRRVIVKSYRLQD